MTQHMILSRCVDECQEKYMKIEGCGAKAMFTNDEYLSAYSIAHTEFDGNDIVRSPVDDITYVLDKLADQGFELFAVTNDTWTCVKKVKP